MTLRSFKTDIFSYKKYHIRDKNTKGKRGCREEKEEALLVRRPCYNALLGTYCVQSERRIREWTERRTDRQMDMYFKILLCQILAN